MTAGLPGTGIGGIFYILLALMMPIREAWLMLMGRGTSLKRWLNCLLQVANASGILAGLWGMGWLLGQAVQIGKTLLLTPGGMMHNFSILQAAQNATNIISTASAYLAFVTLASVVGGVEIFRLVYKALESGSLSARPNAESAK